MTHAIPSADLLELVRRDRVIGIVRAASAEQAYEQAISLIDASLTVVEVSLTTPGAPEVIARLLRDRGRPGVAIGAGTVCTDDDATRVLDAGAQFLVSPVYSPAVVARAAADDVASFPGCLTPTEMFAAVEAGATAAKIFPAHLWTPAALRGLLEAVPHLLTVPTGGVTAATAPDWIAAGALAVGMGASLAREPDEPDKVVPLIDELRRIGRR